MESLEKTKEGNEKAETMEPQFFNCGYCTQKPNSITDLKNHMQRNHEGNKQLNQFTCDKTNVVGMKKSEIYSCNDCGKNYIYSSALKNHEKIHDYKKDEKPFIIQLFWAL